MKKILILALSLCYAGELEVNGDLTVVGQIQSPTLDALTGMKPERIYQFKIDGWSSDIVVPDGKLWMINTGTLTNNITIRLDGFDYGYLYHGSGITSFYAFPSQLINIYSSGNVVISIFEYPISGSGTDQGMDYIEP